MIANFLPAAATSVQLIVPCQWLTSIPSTMPAPASAVGLDGAEAGVRRTADAAGARARTRRRARPATIETWPGRVPRGRTGRLGRAGSDGDTRWTGSSVGSELS